MVCAPHLGHGEVSVRTKRAMEAVGDERGQRQPRDGATRDGLGIEQHHLDTQTRVRSIKRESALRCGLSVSYPTTPLMSCSCR